MATTTGDIRKAKTIGNKTESGEFFNVKVEADAKQATFGLITVDSHVVRTGAQTYAQDTRWKPCWSVTKTAFFTIQT